MCFLNLFGDVFPVFLCLLYGIPLFPPPEVSISFAIELQIRIDA